MADRDTSPTLPAPAWLAIGAILFTSGFCSLVYQVAWLRLLRLVFGVSTASQAAVVAIFMGGLGLGGYLFGRRLRRVEQPLRLYAALELGIALTAGLSPWLVEGARAVYVSLGGESALGLPLASALRLLLAALVLGVPTTLMGGTLPAVAQAVERGADRARRDTARLYGVNTLGAVCGAFLTTFFFIEWLGLSRALWVAALVNLLLAVFARALARDAAFAGAPPPAPMNDAGERRGPLSRPARIVLPAAALVGFFFFLMEIVWYRMLAPVLGGSSYTFGLILAVALAGIGLGGLAYARGPRRHSPTLYTLAATCALEAGFLALPFALGDRLAWFASAVRSLSALGFSGLVASWTLVAAVVVLPAAVVAGYQFPLLIALLGQGRRRVGYEVGLVYAWNTWGAILGSLAGGFGLLPLLTAPRLWRLSAWSLAALALVLALLGHRRERRPAKLAAAVALALAAAALALAPGPTAYWRHTPIGAGRTPSSFADSNGLVEYLHDVRRALLVEADGRESSVALLTYNDLSLIVNGKSDGSARGDAPTQVMGGLVGALLHPRPQQALVIGLGTGTTAGWLARVESIERVDVVELEPAVVDFARRFGPVNEEVLSSPKTRLVVGDGREHVLTAEASYDLIFSEPSNPYRAGVADLFSQDFYRAVAARLAPGGVYLQWLQGYGVDAGVVQTVYATLGSVFPHVETWQIHVSDLLLVASNAPLEHDLEGIRRRAREEPFRRALWRTWGVEGVEGFYSGYVAGDRLTRAFLDSPYAEISTDDRPAVEFGFARGVGRGLLLRREQLAALARQLGADRPPVAGGLDLERVEEARQLRRALGVGWAVPAAVDGPAGLLRRAREIYGQGDLRAAGRAWAAYGGEPRLLFDRLLAAEVLADRGDPGAEPLFEEIAAVAPTEVEALRARLAWRRGEPDAAAARFVAAFRQARTDGWFHVPLLHRALALAEEAARAEPRLAAELFEAVAEPFAAYQLESNRRRLRVSIAESLGERCAEAFEIFEPHVPWEERILAARWRCYDQSGHPLAARARDDLADYRAAAPPSFVLGPGASGTESSEPLIAPGSSESLGGKT